MMMKYVMHLIALEGLLKYTVYKRFIILVVVVVVVFEVILLGG